MPPKALGRHDHPLFFFDKSNIAINTAIGLAVWLGGNALASINVVALRQTRSVPGWVTSVDG